jgi:riboflavin synthase
MFTGLIEDIGEIKKITRIGSGKQLTLKSRIPAAEINLGDSIAVDGVCLTVTGFVEGGFSVDVSPESLKRTTLSAIKAGRRVNLERALRLSDRLGGHLVSGHVDGAAVVSSVVKKDDFIKIDFKAEGNILKYIIEKGSVTIDGISLTVNGCSKSGFEVMIIPHTFSHTTLSLRKKGDKVNIENDIIGKYVEKLIIGAEDGNGAVTKDLLSKYNFM